jgi:hypothetical protein
MSTSRPQFFEVTAVEHFEVEEGKEVKDPIKHLWRESILGFNEDDIKFQVKRKLASGLKSDKAVQSLNRRLRIDVTCPFPG